MMGALPADLMNLVSLPSHKLPDDQCTKVQSDEGTGSRMMSKPALKDK